MNLELQEENITTKSIRTIEHILGGYHGELHCGAASRGAERPPPADSPPSGAVLPLQPDIT